MGGEKGRRRNVKMEGRNERRERRRHGMERYI